MSAMTVISPRPALSDIVRSVVVVVFALVQAVVAGLAASGALGEPVVSVAERYATPLLPASWVFVAWVPIYAGFLGYAAYQALPSQRTRQVHRETGRWLAASAAFNAAAVLALGAGWLPLAEVLVIGLLASVALVFGRLTRVPAESVGERVLMRTTVALAAGWTSLAVAVVTASTGAWIGLPAGGALAAIAAVVVLLAVAAIVCWAVLSGTAVVAYAVGAAWMIVGIALNGPPDAVVVAGAIAIVAIIGSTARRLSTAGNPPRAAWG
jgi:translocator protein